MMSINRRIGETMPGGRRSVKFVVLVLAAVLVTGCVGSQEAKNTADLMVAASDLATTALTAVETYEEKLISSHNNLAKNYQTLEGVYHTSLKEIVKAELKVAEEEAKSMVDAAVIELIKEMPAAEQEARADAGDKIFKALEPIRVFVNSFETEATKANVSAAAAGPNDYKSQYEAASARSRYHRALAVYYSMELELGDAVDSRLAASKAGLIGKLQEAAKSHKQTISDFMATAVNTVDEKAMTATEIERLKAMNLAGLKLYVSAVKSSGEAFKKYLDQASIFAKAFTNGGKDNLLKAVFTNTVDPVSIKDVKAAAKELAASLVEGPKATAKALVESASTALKGTAQSSGEDIKKGVEQAVREKVDDIKDQASALDPNKPSVTE